MILSTQTDILSQLYGEAEAVKMIAKAGFDAVDYSQFDMRTNEEHPVLAKNYKNYLFELKKTADHSGVVFNQSHAPFPSYIEDDHEYSKRIMEKLKRSIEAAHILGVRQICIHPATFRNDDDRELEFNAKLYNSLLPYVKGAGMRIGVENMFWRDKDSKAIRPGACGTSQKMIKLFDTLDTRYFTCLLDIGHCGLCGEKPQDFIRALGGARLGALHVHDNNHKEDMHTLPFTRSIDWNEVTKALADIGYSGEFTFEADLFFEKLPQEFIPTALKYMHDVGRQLVSMIETKN